MSGKALGWPSPPREAHKWQPPRYKWENGGAVLKIKELRPREVRRLEGCWKEDREWKEKEAGVILLWRRTGDKAGPRQAEQRTTRNREYGARRQEPGSQPQLCHFPAASLQVSHFPLWASVYIPVKWRERYSPLKGMMKLTTLRKCWGQELEYLGLVPGFPTQQMCSVLYGPTSSAVK